MDTKTNRKKSSKADRAEFANELNADINKDKNSTSKNSTSGSDSDTSSSCH